MPRTRRTGSGTTLAVTARVTRPGDLGECAGGERAWEMAFALRPGVEGVRSGMETVQERPPGISRHRSRRDSSSAVAQAANSMAPNFEYVPSGGTQVGTRGSPNSRDVSPQKVQLLRS